MSVRVESRVGVILRSLFLGQARVSSLRTGLCFRSGLGPKSSLESWVVLGFRSGSSLGSRLSKLGSRLGHTRGLRSSLESGIKSRVRVWVGSGCGQCRGFVLSKAWVSSLDSAVGVESLISSQGQGRCQCQGRDQGVDLK